MPIRKIETVSLLPWPWPQSFEIKVFVTTILWRRYSYYSSFTNEEARGNWELSHLPMITQLEGRSLCINVGDTTPEGRLSSCGLCCHCFYSFAKVCLEVSCASVHQDVFQIPCFYSFAKVCLEVSCASVHQDVFQIPSSWCYFRVLKSSELSAFPAFRVLVYSSGEFLSHHRLCYILQKQGNPLGPVERTRRSSHTPG